MNERVSQRERERARRKEKVQRREGVVGRCRKETARVALEAVAEVRDQKPPKRRTAG